MKNSCCTLEPQPHQREQGFIAHNFVIGYMTYVRIGKLQATSKTQKEGHRRPCCCKGFVVCLFVFVDCP